MKRIVTMQDLSCLGKCSLSVVLPTISAMGVECAVVPTAVLSTHMAFPKPEMEGLDHLAQRILDHWKTLSPQVDGILTGYLAHPGQVELAQRLIREFRGEETFVAVDPAMGDHGRLYTGTSEEMIFAMAELCRRADLVLPNVTEAALMTGLPYRPAADIGYLRELAAGLRDLGCREVLVTGASEDAQSTGFYWSCGKVEKQVLLPREPRNCHGTGDLFAAVVAGAVVQGLDTPRAGTLAAQFVRRAIQATPLERDSRYGVCFESELEWLAQQIRR